MSDSPDAILFDWINGYYYGDDPPDIVWSDVRECIKFLEENGYEIKPIAGEP